MNTNELIEGIGLSAATAKPAQEYCFLWMDHWSMCMTKSEWSGWVQGVAVCAALIAPMFIWLYSRFHERKVAKIIFNGYEEKINKIDIYLSKGYSLLGYEVGFNELVELIQICIKFIKENRPIVDAKSNKLDPLLKSRILEFYRLIESFSDDVIIAKTRFEDVASSNHINLPLLKFRFEELKIKESINSICKDIN